MSVQVAIAAICAFGLAACESGETRPNEAETAALIAEGQRTTLEEAMAVDREFSAYAQTHPMGEAFAAYMDSVEGMMIGPGDVTVGEAAIRAGFEGWPEDLKMSWEPDGGHGAASGDLAVTTGRYTRTRNDEVVGTGRYVSVWKKNADGEWKGAIDLGAPDPQPVQEDVAVDQHDDEGAN